LLSCGYNTELGTGRCPPSDLLGSSLWRPQETNLGRCATLTERFEEMQVDTEGDVARGDADSDSGTWWGLTWKMLVLTILQ
jgi:hypothetical protein